MKMKWEGMWQFVHKRNGQIIYDTGFIHNDLVNQGELSVLDAYFRAENIPSGFYVGLAYDSLAKTDTLGDILGEPVGSGYSRKPIPRNSTGWPTVELNEGNYRVVSQTVNFQASGGTIGPVNTAFLSTSADNTGKLIAFVTLPLERTILDGDEAFLNIRVKLK